MYNTKYYCVLLKCSQVATSVDLLARERLTDLAAQIDFVAIWPKISKTMVADGEKELEYS